MTELSQEILSELEFIKWLLVILVIIGLYFSFLYFAVISKATNAKNTFGKLLQQKKRETELAEMLAKGDAIGAKFTALEWTVSHPNEPWAHWYLAKAFDQLGDYIEAKKSLQKLQKINPSWNDSIEPWLSSIEKHLTPRGVE